MRKGQQMPEAQRLAMCGKPKPPGFGFGKTMGPEFSETMKEVWTRPGARKAQSERLEGKPKTLVHRKKIGDALRGKPKSLEVRAKMCVSQQEAQNRPDVVIKKSENAKKWYKTHDNSRKGKKSPSTTEDKNPAKQFDVRVKISNAKTGKKRPDITGPNCHLWRG